jgi:hypothetical protein
MRPLILTHPSSSEDEDDSSLNFQAASPAEVAPSSSS